MKQERKLFDDAFFHFLEPVMVGFENVGGGIECGVGFGMGRPWKREEDVEICVEHGVIGRGGIVAAQLLDFAVEEGGHVGRHLDHFRFGYEFVDFIAVAV